jgi:hypothetical protein
MTAEGLRIYAERAVVWAPAAGVEYYKRPKGMPVVVVTDVKKSPVDLSYKRQLIQVSNWKAKLIENNFLTVRPSKY